MNIIPMKSPNGNDVPNQVIVIENDRKTFISYGVNVARIEGGRVTLDERYWNYSKTTGKYRNIFLGETGAETAKKISSGEYELADLNGED